MISRHICTVAFAALLACCTSAIAGPTFKGVTFGKQSTHCDAESARISIVPDGSGVSISFDKMQAEAGNETRRQDYRRCDMTLELAAPLEAPATIQIDVRGETYSTGQGSSLASAMLNGYKQILKFKMKDDDGFQRMLINLPKGAKKFDMTFETSAKGKFPNSTALIAIDSLDIVFKRESFF